MNQEHNSVTDRPIIMIVLIVVKRKSISWQWRKWGSGRLYIASMLS